MRSIRVAAIQATSLNGTIERNLENAGRLVHSAARKGAELVLCPEFLAAGYIYDEIIWNSAEPAGGPTERWLARMAGQHRILIGASFLEAEGDQFYNTFSLFGRDGTLLGRVRKASLPFFEGWYFAPCPKPQVIQTDIGRICVGICNDNQTAGFLNHVIQADPDLILMPHSAPTPRLPLPIDPLYRRLYNAQLSRVAPRYAESLGVPVVMANKVSGSPASRTPLPGLNGITVPLHFHGYSCICDAEGRTLAYCEDEEMALVAEIVLDPGRKSRSKPAPSGYWSFAPEVLAKPMGGLMRLFEFFGRRSYRSNPRRASKARQVSSK